MINNNKLFTVLAIFVGVLILGIGYAALFNVSLNVKGSASASSSDYNFAVRFSGNPSVKKNNDIASVSASITGDHSATISVANLTTKGDKASATYTIKNVSTDLSADLSATTSVAGVNPDYFNVYCKFEQDLLTAGKSTTVVVTVELAKTPVDGDKSATIGVLLTAKPVQP